MSKDEIRKYIKLIDSMEQYLDENTPQQLIDKIFELKCRLLMYYMI
jgi:hypothetical protein